MLLYSHPHDCNRTHMVTRTRSQPRSHSHAHTFTNELTLTVTLTLSRQRTHASADLDDMESGWLVEGNHFESVGDCMFIGGGRQNIVRNNTFVNCTVPGERCSSCQHSTLVF
jgi:hypothetical protein